MAQEEKSFEEICEYFGYDPEKVRQNDYEIFPTDDFMPRLKEMYSFARYKYLARKKSRIIIDHDPRFPMALVQIETNKDIFLSYEQGLRLHEVEAQLKAGQSLEEFLGHTGLDQSIRETLGFKE